MSVRVWYICVFVCIHVCVCIWVIIWTHWYAHICVCVDECVFAFFIWHFNPSSVFLYIIFIAHCAIILLYSGCCTFVTGQPLTSIKMMNWTELKVTPLLTHWSYCSLALSHRNDTFGMCCVQCGMRKQKWNTTMFGEMQYQDVLCFIIIKCTMNDEIFVSHILWSPCDSKLS